MAPKAIQPQNTIITCAVCGRTLLQGEEPEVYLVSGTRRHVCELCTVRANHQGWIRESEGPQIGHRSRDDRRSLLSRLRGRRERPAPAAAPSGPEAGFAEPAVPAEPVAPADAELPREPRHVHAVPTSEELKASRAVEVFNGSEHPRTVAGVARSLGVPDVSVLPVGGQASMVRIVVAWELCWYRWEVDLADEGGNGVRPAGQGYELAELAPGEQAGNAGADEHGRLVLAG
ncbi:MAG: hypothetical protein QOE65_180 [Solirubrobacteraceae bacterium]|jgi:hypothetical protein|nr:hypothetical protein [Solirubrobacteraceae bacterium]